ncbi:MAG: glycoside hydrolase family 95 protein [Bryobacterales bacterium]|nr:glycoside hydrolase family 95 protein [Bryobacteraceae bacterium]MDW8130108.1 glycoside hydrolase family 95 protein [Bryobacterales bacterium]
MQPRPLTRRQFLGSPLAASLAPDRTATDLLLWYREPAPDWNEALPIGNGRLGAMVFGGVPVEQIQLNEDTLYSDEPGRRDLPLDVTAGFDHVLTLLRQRRYAEAEQYITRHWLGRTWPCYQPLGDLYLEFDHSGEVSGYRRELDLTEAVCRVRYRYKGILYEREIFASHPDQLIVLRVRASRPGALNFLVRLRSVHPTASARAAGRELVLTGQLPGLVVRRPLEWIEQRGEQWKYPELWDREGRRRPHAKQVLYADEIGGLGMRFQARLRVRCSGGKVVPGGDHLRVQGAHEALLLLAAASSFNGFDKSPSREGADPEARARTFLQTAAGKSYRQIRLAHVRDYRALFDRVRLRLGRRGPHAGLPTDERIERFAGDDDPSLVALVFQFGRYLMIAGSRPGTQPLNLQGLWNREVIPPWASAYTLNINAQMNYWPAELTNLSECHEPLLRLARELAANGRRVARQMYKRRGWVAHHNTTIWRCAQPVDYGALPSFWPMAAGWLCRHLWEHYLFTGNRRFLAGEAYPLMKEAAEFYLDWLIEDGEGRLITPVGVSPENRFRYRDHDGRARTAGVSLAPTMDMAIIRDLFANTIEAARLLGRDEDFRQELERKLPRLLPYRIGSRGQLQEWMEDFEEAEPQHRHVSHLYPLHPGSELSPRKTPELAAAARRSLELRGDGGSGWARAWKINLWARLQDGNRAYALLKNLIQPAREAPGKYNRPGLLPNLLCSHPPFQIDGNFGATAGIAEMLLQSHAGEIHLLPALPAAWPEGEVRGLCARGAFEVSIAWKEGRLANAEIASKLGAAATVRYRELVVALPPARGRYYLDEKLRLYRRESS